MKWLMKEIKKVEANQRIKIFKQRNRPARVGFPSKIANSTDPLIN